MKIFEKAIFFSAVAVLLGIVGLNINVQEFVSYDNNVLTGAFVNQDVGQVLVGISWVWIIVVVLVAVTFVCLWKRRN
mgnify:CR=1 FL=1